MPANISPLAQTFKVNEQYPQGCFITSVDLFFAFKDANEVSPVEVQIVETLNGYPTENVVPSAKALVYPNDILVSANSTVPTKFKFESLVFLEANTEYAIKVMSNSLKYKVWTAIMGGTRVDNPAVLITQQPALGSLFKSQNNSTWTPEQLQDLTFRLNRAKFNSGVISNVVLVEAPTSDLVVLPPNPFKITDGQTLVKVHHENHGLVAGMFVEYSGSVDTQFNAKFAVTKVINSDYYIITTAAQTATNFVGGGSVTVEKNIKFDTVRVLGIEEGKDVGTKVTARFSSSVAVDSADTDVTPNVYTDLTTNKFVHSSINKTQKLAGASSFSLKAALSSINDAVSPVIDLNQLEVQLIGNKINSPSVVSDVEYLIDWDEIASGASISYVAATNKISIPSTTDYTKIKVGAWVRVNDTGGLNDLKTGYISEIDTTNNTLTIVGDALQDQSGRTATITQYTSFISEIANGGTAESKTITKQVNLAKQCQGFRVIVQANVHTDAEIEMYVRTGLQTDATKLSDSLWTKSLISYKKSVNESEFTEYEYDITGLEKFDAFQFKFVFLSSNSAVTPKIKLLRVIAHA